MPEGAAPDGIGRRHLSRTGFAELTRNATTRPGLLSRAAGTAALVVVLTLFVGCAPKPVSRAGFFFGTVIEVTVSGAGSAAGETALDAVFARFEELEQRLSATVAGSDVDRLGDGAGEAVSVSDDALRVLSRAFYFADLTGGAFDPTIGALVALWGIGTDGARVPSYEEIADARALVDYRRASVDEAAGTATLSHGQRADLGGIAKGYAADEARRILKGAGIEHALVNLGGNILTLGGRPQGGPWRIGLQDPFGERGDYIGVLHMTDGTAVTSGAYERYFEKDGVRYHHLLDPSTGYPARSGLASVTVVAPSSMDADALSTAAFILGPEEGMALIESLAQTGAIFVTDDRRVIVTGDLAESFKLTDETYTLQKR
ncbi:MAG: FAD:protein FMN transferase [Christensenellales bacterium]|jgi:thiamine biosynthesis lipoprotein